MAHRCSAQPCYLSLARHVATFVSRTEDSDSKIDAVEAPVTVLGVTRWSEGECSRTLSALRAHWLKRRAGSSYVLGGRAGRGGDGTGGKEADGLSLKG